MDFIINVTHSSANTGNISGDSKIENFMDMVWDMQKKPPLVTEVLSAEGAAYLLRILFCPDGVSIES
jgi:hypothetical protein